MKGYDRNQQKELGAYIIKRIEQRLAKRKKEDSINEKIYIYLLYVKHKEDNFGGVKI